MKKIITACFLVCFVMLSISVAAQSDGSENNFKDRTSFKISTDFLSQPAHSSSDWGYSSFLYSGPAVGVEINYFLTNHFIINAGLTYTGSNSKSNGVIDYAVRPEDDAIHTIKSEDKFRSFSLEPKAKLEFSLNQFGFFWSAGPIISLASLHTENQTSTFENPKHFTTNSQNTSTSIGIGAQASTGINYYLTQKLGLSYELGYKTLSHQSLETMHDFGAQTESVKYTLNSVFQRVGITLKF